MTHHTAQGSGSHGPPEVSLYHTRSWREKKVYEEDWSVMHAIWLLTLLLLDLSKVVEADEKIQQVQYRSSIVSWFSKWDPRFHEVLPRTTLYAQYSTHLKTSVDQSPEWWIKPFQAAIKKNNDKCNKRQAYMWNTTWTLNIQTVRINRLFFCQDVFIKKKGGEVSVSTNSEISGYL